ncbi:hypothetical protein F4821DRAFT_5058 [Hypoxylon rubiginosum]|uniref:Uncharacterized protein n=1 Tax=Hypoxylon rubiginosum TaxID=110542 RepID=A0ACC0DLL7_9PEZI|nr:hypothetical protein F4821DRAFT_5058 [Hypoxylon rubiginosum]
MLGVRAHFKGGLMRLEVPPGRRCPRMWNTSARPNMSLSGILTEASWQRCFVVELNRITGITFFFSSNRIVGVHIHDSREPYALSTYRRIFQSRDHNLVWVYLPILEDDPLLALDICRSSLPDESRQFWIKEVGITSHEWETFRPMDSIRARTKKVGEIALGPQHFDTAPKNHAEEPPTIFVYSDTFGGHPLPVVATYYKQRSQFPMRQPFPRLCPIGEPAYFSQAPLDDVASIQAFYMKLQELGEFGEICEFCTGMIFKYRNGGCRAVGQCRIDIDLTKQIMEPDWISYKNDLLGLGFYEPKRYMPQVHFDHNHPLYGRGTVDAWTRRPLRGQLRFWFTDQSSFISIDDT